MPGLQNRKLELNMKPKVFISYSWTSQSHQERVREWAERLISDGVDIVLDLYDLKEGQDKYAFMEKMVSDRLALPTNGGHADKSRQ
jgi:hypothetical protein